QRSTSRFDLQFREVYTSFMRKPPPQLTHTLLNLSTDTVDILTNLTQDLRDRVGRAIGHSTTVRALLRATKTAGQPFLAVVEEEILKEMNRGTLWGQTVASICRRKRQQKKQRA